MSKRFELIENYLINFLKEETFKTGLNGGVVGLSGGIDSAVVAVLAKKAFNDRLLCVMMPSHYSSSSSVGDAKELAEKFDLKYEIVEIAALLEAYSENQNSTNLRVGNFSARMRMSILFDISARERALVLGTSNKSELMLGYGTLFGDLASAINPIGDLYKSEIFAFAEYLGVCDSIVNKPPSADLWEGQSDEDDLGYTYAQLDEALKEYVENRLSRDEMIEKGFEDELVDLIITKIYQNQFKRKPPIIAKLTSRTIGHDFLYPRDIKL
ncbi:MAG: NAD+ synthase [Epsilonproteobacteria bacterium]|nr:NAD+ synthase [Campylobacterota bacterium]